MQVKTQSNSKILIVSDDLLQLKLLKKSLKSHGAVSCLPANQLTIKSDKIIEVVNLIILDVRTFEDNGLEFCEWISNHHGQIKIVLLAGLSHQIKLSQAIKEGNAHDYLLFPIDEKKLELIVTKFIITLNSKNTLKGNNELSKSSPLIPLTDMMMSNEPPAAKIKPGSILAVLNKKHPDIFNGKWQASDQFKR